MTVVAINMMLFVIVYVYLVNVTFFCQKCTKNYTGTIDTEEPRPWRENSHFRNMFYL